MGLTLFAQQLDLLVYTQDSGHLGIKVRISFFHVIAHLVGFKRLCREYLRDRAAPDLRQTRMAGPAAVAAGMLGQKMGGPQFLGITELFGFAAGQRHQSGSCWAPDEPLSSPAGQVAECRLNSQLQSFVDAAIDLGPVGAHLSGNGGNCFSPGVGQKNSGPFDTAHALGPRSGRALQLLSLRLTQFKRLFLALKGHTILLASLVAGRERLYYTGMAINWNVI